VGLEISGCYNVENKQSAVTYSTDYMNAVADYAQLQVLVFVSVAIVVYAYTYKDEQHACFISQWRRRRDGCGHAGLLRECVWH
jgi:hypothetical protein